VAIVLEGHSAWLGVELLRSGRHASDQLRTGKSPYNIPLVREACYFTMHTPVEAGQNHCDQQLVAQVADGIVDLGTLKQLAGADSLNMTRLALNLSKYINGVAMRPA
jgi:glycogen phosphorylase